VGACQTSGVGEGVVPMMSQYFGPAQVSAALRQDIIACWIVVSNAGFPFPPVDASIVAPEADDLVAGLSSDRCRLIVVRTGDADQVRGADSIESNGQSRSSHATTAS
jgi:hypothetical protein